MKLNELMPGFATFILTAMLGGPIFAHTALKESAPMENAVVNPAPEQLQLTFTAAVSLVKLELLHGGEHELDIGFTPSPEPNTEFAIQLPALAPAMYRVNWAAVGADGHTVSNSFSFTVDLSAPVGHDHAAAHLEHGQADQHDASHQHDPAHHGADSQDHSDNIDH